MGFCWVYKRRWVLLVASIIFAVIVAMPAGNMQQTASYKVYFDKNNAQLMASEKLAAEYANSDNVLFVIAPKNGNVFTTQTLKTITELTEKSWQLPYSTRVDSITNYQHSYATQDDVFVEDLVVRPEALTSDELKAIEATALSEPNLVNRLISSGGAVTGVNVTINFSDENVDQETREVVAAARALVEQTLADNSNIDMYLTGIVLMNNAFPESSEKDGATLVPAMLLLILIGLGLLLRAVTPVVATLFVMLFSIAGAMGVGALLGYKINPVSGAAPIIILTICVASCVHILMSFMAAYRNQGESKANAIQQALTINFKSIALTSLTTAVGFLSMNFSEAPPFRELGNISAAGIVMAFILSYSLLPALLCILPIKQKAPSSQKATLLGAVVQCAENLVLAYPKLIVAVGIGLGLMLSAAAFKNELNEDFVRYFDESFDVRKSTEFALNNLSGVSIIEYDIQAGEFGSVTDPNYLKHLDGFTQWLYQQPEVIHVNTFSDTIKRLNKSFNGDDNQFNRLPENGDLIAQYTLMYETSLPYGLGITERVKLDKSASRLTVTLNDVTNNQLLALEQRASQWQQDNFPPSMQSQGLGWSMMFGRIAQKNIESMIIATVSAVLLISFMLILPFKSVRLGVISLIPNMLPALVALGIWGLTVGMIGLAASIITALTFGIVVDDSIHLINRYILNRRDLGHSAALSIRNSLQTVGKAIVVTSIVLCAGFSILAFSGFNINSIIGVLSATTILVALIMDLLVLPALLLVLDRWLFKPVNAVSGERTEQSNENSGMASTIAGHAAANIK